MVSIQPLSDALGDLYKEFNALKERLVELTSKFDTVEGFVDDVRAGRKASPLRGETRPPGLISKGDTQPSVTGTGFRRGRRTRVVVRKVQRTAGDSELGRD